MTHTLHLGDCAGVLQFYKENTFDSIVTDPPYGLNFMNKKWDYQVPSIDVWKECLRVLKPGGHLLSFSSARTYHRMVVNVEDAGFEIRDQIMWVYGSGFPKSQNVSIAIDKKLAGMKPRGKRTNYGTTMKTSGTNHLTSTGELIGSDKAMPKHEPLCEQSKQWEGWGTNLKPAHEPIVLARKPISEKTIALNVLKWGTGAINVDKSRCEGGRFPANFIHNGIETEWSHYFYCAKASKKERNAGCEHLPDKEWMLQGLSGSVAEDGVSNKNGTGTVRGVSKNNHPTVKPQALMSYLCGLITPPGGTILDPFMGSGSTGLAAIASDYSFVGIELDKDYLNIAKHRIENG